MIWCWLFMKSFAGIRLLVVIRWTDELFVKVDATIFRKAPTNVGAAIERQELPFNRSNRYQKIP